LNPKRNPTKFMVGLHNNNKNTARSCPFVCLFP
jgi:hypothetical protein